MLRWFLAGIVLLGAWGCASPNAEAPAVIVAAAANLDRTIPQLVNEFEETSGVKAVVSLGSTSNLTQQIENGAPFDLFLSADAAHIDQLIQGGFAEAASRRVYVRGRLALWVRQDSPLKLSGPEALLDPQVRYVSVPNPAFAPYGIAALEALDRLGYRERLADKIVYAQNVSMAQQYAASGNADIAITALSLAKGSDGVWLELDPSLHNPIEQALAILSAAPHKDDAREFANFLAGDAARRIFDEFGYAPGD